MLQELRTVTRKMTRSDICQMGSNRWFRKRRGYIICGLVALLIIGLGLAPISPIALYIVYGAIVLGCLVMMALLNAAGKAFWFRVKDMPEPIDLDQVK